MEYRKLIKFGNSSHVISLPSEWLKKNKITKGNVVYLDQNGNNELILTPERKETKIEIKEITISLANKSDYDIKRELISAYTNNFKKINIIDNSLEERYDTIKEILQNLIAIEILDHTSNKLVLQDFLDMDNVSIKKIIRRLDILIRAMLMDSRNTRKKDLYNSLMKRDEDVNRLTILANRVVNYYLEHPEKIKPEESLRDIVRFNIISDHMERLADESKRIARILRVLKAPKKFTDKIDSIYQTIEKTYSKIMQSFYQKDNNLAFQSSKAVREKITKICANLYDETKNKESVIVLEKFKTMANHIKVIGRAIYD